jgi:hypothetical protein
METYVKVEAQFLVASTLEMSSLLHVSVTWLLEKEPSVPIEYESWCAV